MYGAVFVLYNYPGDAVKGLVNLLPSSIKVWYAIDVLLKSKEKKMHWTSVKVPGTSNGEEIFKNVKQSSQ